ncbi:MAG: hypothetical protein KGH75_00595 [Rhodospirillales bacterium]|nr:hypothetical protein [Rhodospirillales bacterium]
MHLDTGVAMYEPIHLDGLLSYAVVTHAIGGGADLVDAPDPYDLPLPLACLWRDPVSGLPLWAATEMEPLGMAHRTRVTWTRKQVEAHHVVTASGKPYAPRSGNGPGKDMQIPLPITMCATWQADVIGDARIIHDLLSSVGQVGKKGSQGWGHVVSWQIQSLMAWNLCDAQGDTRRIVPGGALASHDGGAQWMGWTPPYWRNRMLCLPTGTHLGEWRWVDRITTTGAA